MDYTQHYNLKKPAYGEAVDVKDLNDNADITDAQLNTLAGLVAARLLKTDLTNQIINDATKVASAATVYSVNKKADDLNSDLAASSVKCVDGAGMAGSALYADKFGKIICIRGYVKPTNGYSFDAWNRQIVAWLPNNNYLPRGQVTGLTIYSDSRLKIEINVDNSVVLQNLSGSAITANGESGIDIMITYCCQ
ncbi:MAG: hypothetical protein ACLSIP_28805 [Hungatella sp.]